MADSARWCATCGAYGDHHTDRHPTNPLCPKTERERDEARTDVARLREAFLELYSGAVEALGAPEPDKKAARKRLSLLLDKHEVIKHEALAASKDPCTECDGRGYYTTWPHTTCPTCKGSGQLQVAPSDAKDLELCGLTMVGSGTDTYDPACELPAGHEGSCKSSAAVDQHRLSDLDTGRERWPTNREELHEAQARGCTCRIQWTDEDPNQDEYVWHPRCPLHGYKPEAE